MQIGVENTTKEVNRMQIQENSQDFQSSGRARTHALRIELQTIETEN